MKFYRLIIIVLFGLYLPASFAFAGTVLSQYKYAWSNNVGYINFEDLIVGDTALSGYAWSANAGWIKFNPAKGGVFNNGKGDLSGSAWGEGLGWINFDNVSINGATGRFSGTATGDLAGTITFDCPNYCDVRTDWRSNQSSQVSGGYLRPPSQINPPYVPTVIPKTNTPITSANSEETTENNILPSQKPSSPVTNSENNQAVNVTAQPNKFIQSVNNLKTFSNNYIVKPVWKVVKTVSNTLMTLIKYIINTFLIMLENFWHGLYIFSSSVF